jgi:hypothetical protein
LRLTATRSTSYILATLNLSAINALDGQADVGVGITFLEGGVPKRKKELKEAEVPKSAWPSDNEIFHEVSNAAGLAVGETLKGLLLKAAGVLP